MFDGKLNLFFKSFVRLELCFLANKSYQEAAWRQGREDEFALQMMLYSESWLTIVSNRKKIHLSDHQFNRLQKLYSMVDKFQLNHLSPETPCEYLALQSNPEWQAIQNFARDIHRQLSQSIGKTTS